jgi:hypothetical protein
MLAEQRSDLPMEYGGSVRKKNHLQQNATNYMRRLRGLR